MRLIMIVVLASFFIPTPMIGAETPEVRAINFTAVLKHSDTDEPYIECMKIKRPKANEPAECEIEQTYTLGFISYSALVRPEKGLSMDEESRRWRLSRRLLEKDAVAIKLNNAEVNTIMKAVLQMDGLNLDIKGQVYCSLDPVTCVDKK